MAYRQKQAVDAFYAALDQNEKRSLLATSNLNASGLESLVGLLRIIKDKVENGGAGYPPGAETDVRALVAETKQNISDNATAHIAAIESVNDVNYAGVAASLNIEL